MIQQIADRAFLQLQTDSPLEDHRLLGAGPIGGAKRQERERVDARVLRFLGQEQQLAGIALFGMVDQAEQPQRFLPMVHRP